MYKILALPLAISAFVVTKIAIGLFKFWIDGDDCMLEILFIAAFAFTLWWGVWAVLFVTT